jgi:hypothetical protein
MRLSAIFAFAAVFLNPALAAPLDVESRATQKLLICSDSTTANYAAGNALQGQVSHSLQSRTGADQFPDGVTISVPTRTWMFETWPRMAV